MYRMWDHEKEHWIKDFYIMPSGEAFTFKKKLFGSKLVPMPEDKYTLHRNIGACDRNGKPIYEGDIIVNTEDSDIRGVVAYSSDHAAYYIFDEKHGSYYGILNATRDEMEIIGNCFENPDVLVIEDKIEMKNR